MKILGIEHVGIAVKNLKKDAPFWKHILGIHNSSTEVLDDQEVTTDIYDTSRGKIELLEATKINSVISNYIDKYEIDYNGEIYTYYIDNSNNVYKLESEYPLTLMVC